VLDEPTSSLDSAAAIQLVNTLRGLLANFTVIITIHQPRPEIFDLLDDVVVLANSRVAYRGRASQAHKYFMDLDQRLSDCLDPAFFDSKSWLRNRQSSSQVDEEQRAAAMRRRSSAAANPADFILDTVNRSQDAAGALWQDDLHATSEGPPSISHANRQQDWRDPSSVKPQHRRSLGFLAQIFMQHARASRDVGWRRKLILLALWTITGVMIGTAFVAKTATIFVVSIGALAVVTALFAQLGEVELRVGLFCNEYDNTKASCWAFILVETVTYITEKGFYCLSMFLSAYFFVTPSALVDAETVLLTFLFLLLNTAAYMQLNLLVNIIGRGSTIVYLNIAIIGLLGCVCTVGMSVMC
jgi:hypothetical protein